MRQELKDQMKKQIDELKTIRDEIRLDLHLASMNMKDEWRELERKLPDAVDESGRSAGEVLQRLGNEVRKFRERLRDGADGAQVAEVMSKEVVACQAGDPLSGAVALMWENDLGFLPVVDGAGHLVGVLTDRDACIAAWSRGLRMDQIAVETVMSRAPRTCAPSDDCDDALEALTEARVHRLPVVQSGKLVGVVSLNSLARAAGQGQRQAALATLVKITEPRATSPAPGPS
jgi:CBS domain-containing protein